MVKDGKPVELTSHTLNPGGRAALPLHRCRSPQLRLAKPGR